MPNIFPSTANVVLTHCKVKEKIITTTAKHLHTVNRSYVG